MGSSRFPGKPMAKLLGKPMIGHVYERVARCAVLSQVVVATCDEEIASYVKSIDGRAIMTGNHHERASDRCAEALEIVEREDGVRYDIVVMVQGDEPMTVPEMIDEAVNPMIADPSIQVVNLLGVIATDEEFADRNCIKVVCDRNSNALCFSREPIPTQARMTKLTAYKQVCIIPFRRDYLIHYTKMAPSPLEIAESVDMMRILENGDKVRMVPTEHATHAIDTPEDLRRVEDLMAAFS
jgi:3-deoxy-manno-octulosonate cytidylyltransferase (CMP-KDO synthetase)